MKLEARPLREHRSPSMTNSDSALEPGAKHYFNLGATLVLVVAFLGLFFYAKQVLLLAFAGILGGVLLDALTSAITRHTPIPRPLALVIVLVTSTGIIVGVGFLLGPSLYEQFLYLSQTLPPQVRALGSSIESSRMAQRILEALPATEDMVSAPKLLGGFTSVLMGLAGGVGGALFVLVVAIFLALRPSAYIDPILRLIPSRRRPAAQHLVKTWGTNLRYWLVARLVSMIVVGLLTGLGLWAVGIPAAGSLGVVAGVLSFIPNLGPTLGALPGILLGLASGPITAVWAAAVYLGVQVLEGNFITPFAEQRAVSLPPAFLITVQLLMGLLTGVMGLLVATPLCVIVVLAIRELGLREDEGEEVQEPESEPTPAS